MKSLLCDIFETIKMMKVHCCELSFAVFYVIFTVVTWYLWQTYNNPVLQFGLSGKPFKVVYYLLASLSRISLINICIHVFYVDIELADE